MFWKPVLYQIICRVDEDSWHSHSTKRQSQDQWPNFGVTMVKKWKL